MTRRPLVARLVALSLATFTAGSCSAAPSAQVPFELSGNYIFIDVRIRDQALSFVFDTGAQGTAVNSEAALGLGLEATASAAAVGAGGATRFPLVRGQTVELDTLRLRGLDVVLVPLGHLEEAVGRPIDGIIGADVLKDRVVVVDHDRQLIEIHSRRGSFRFEEWGPACALRDGPGLFRVHGRIELLEGASIDGEFVVDSGAGRYLELAAPLVREHDLERRVGATYHRPGRSLLSGGSDNLIGHVRRFRFCGHDFPAQSSTNANLPVGLSRATAGVLDRRDLAGLLGNGVLKRYNTVFDLASSRMFLRPSRHWGAPIESDTSGLFLVRPMGGSLRVDSVVGGSPAAEAGVRAGDIVRAIDGQEARTMSLESVRERLRQVGERRRLELVRNGSDLSVELTLRALAASGGS